MIKEALKKHNIAIKALAAQLNKQQSNETQPGTHACTTAPRYKTYREAVQVPTRTEAAISRKAPSLQAAQNQATISIKPKPDKELDKQRILEIIRKQANDSKIKANFTIVNNAGPNLQVKPDIPGTTKEIREALNLCLGEEDCSVSGPLTPRLVIFNIDKGTNSDEILDAINKKCKKEVAKLHKVHEIPAAGTYHAFVDIPGDALGLIFPTGEHKTQINVNMMRLNMEIAKSVRICFHCGHFGHTAARCTATDPGCTHSAGSHQLKDCPKRNIRSSKSCLSCKQANHSATDMQCPVYRRHFQAMISRFF
jgi:hypothetical protein